MKKFGTRRHLIWSKDKTQLVSVKVVDNKVVEIIGNTEGLPALEDQHWLFVSQLCKQAGFRVIPDQWTASCIEVVHTDSFDKLTKVYSLKVIAKHPLSGKIKVTANGDTLTKAKTNFWSRWSEAVSSTGAHTHLNLSEEMYKVC
jgi:hypothetical protein